MPNIKSEQLSLSQHKELQAKKDKHKKLLDLPWPVKLIFIVPLICLIILITVYILYMRHYTGHG